MYQEKTFKIGKWRGWAGKRKKKKKEPLKWGKRRGWAVLSKP